MTSPLDNWQMRLIGFLFDNENIIRIQNAKFIFMTPDKTKQLEQVRENMNSTIMWNFTVAMGISWGVVFLLQKFIPSYGRNINLGNFIIDGGIFALSAGTSVLISLKDINPQIQPLQKRWISSHNIAYLKVMKFMQRHYRIPLLDQIKPFIDKNDQANWKCKYDSLMHQ